MTKPEHHTREALNQLFEAIGMDSMKEYYVPPNGGVLMPYMTNVNYITGSPGYVRSLLNTILANASRRNK
jgi:hypothetical protein